MNMRMERKILSPCMKYSSQTNCCAEIFGVGGKLLDGLGDTAKHEIVHVFLVAVNDGIQFLRQCKNNVEISHVQQIRLPAVNPPLFGKGLAFRTMAVTAGIVGDTCLGIALCLLSSPDCLVLDEPINGLDSEGIVEIRKLLLKLNQEHHITILVSSHILTELQLIADRFVFIKKGVITEDVSKKQLEEKSENQLHMQVDNVAKAAQVLENHYPSIQYDVMPEEKIVIYNHIKDAAAINKLLITNDIIVTAFHTETYKLEEYFLDIVEREGK